MYTRVFLTGAFFTEAICTLGQCVHWGSIYTRAMCSMEQCIHLGSLYNEQCVYAGAVCTLGQCVHFGKLNTRAVCTLWLFLLGFCFYLCFAFTGALFY